MEWVVVGAEYVEVEIEVFDEFVTKWIVYTIGGILYDFA